MSRWLNGFVVMLSLSVLGANLWLVEPQTGVVVARAMARPEVQPGSLPLQQATPAPLHIGKQAPSPFAYIHEDGREEYLPSGVSFEDEHADSGFPGGQAYDSRQAVYHWSSADGGMPISVSPSWP